MKTIILLLSSLFIAIGSPAQSRRSATEEEKRVLLKAGQPAYDLITRFFNNDWDVTYDNFNTDASISLSKKAHVDFAFECDFSKKLDDNFKKKATALNEKIQELAKKQLYDSIQIVSRQFPKIARVSIQVEINRVAIAAGVSDSKNKPVTVNGVSKAFIITGDESSDRNKTCILAFGNWETASNCNNYDEYCFHFIHPPQTPFVENIVVQISGDETVIKEMLQKIGWAELDTKLSL